MRDSSDIVAGISSIRPHHLHLCSAKPPQLSQRWYNLDTVLRPMMTARDNLACRDNHESVHSMARSLDPMPYIPVGEELVEFARSSERGKSLVVELEILPIDLVPYEGLLY